MASTHVTTLTLDLSRIRENISVVRNHLKNNGDVEPGLIAVIKGFGYGTNDIVLAKVYAEEGVDYLAVAYVEEGVQLREAGVEGRIMVLNPDPSTFDKVGEYKLEPSMISLGHLEDFVNWIARNNISGEGLEPIHLNVNTGMHRLGFGLEDIKLLIPLLNSIEGLRLGTVYTHLASTENPDNDFKTTSQLLSFKMFCGSLRIGLKNVKLDKFKTHSLNSSGVVRFPKHGMDYVRIGLILLGSDLSNKGLALRPAVFFRTLVTQVQTVPPGQGVGYGYADPSENEREIAWLPVGYADGYPRSLSDGRGKVWINGQEAPIVGRVCMDLTAVDVTSLGVQVGDEAELFGDHISIETVSEAADTIPYELITRVHQRVTRRVV
ncbi:MAG: alanine racemase [Crocinitomicaceae bacterium]|nr:alanine racemase [Crocinitomicaceae bacterium]|tara:strand:- start:7526 stop:8659 length:1134 start_codon:yes stop_codon:yes gene_type:complete